MDGRPPLLERCPFCRRALADLGFGMVEICEDVVQFAFVETEWCRLASRLMDAAELEDEARRIQRAHRAGRHERDMRWRHIHRGKLN